MIIAGRRLISAMRKIPREKSLLQVVDAAYWAKEVTDGGSRWQFRLASPGISFEGARSGYEWVHQAMHELSATEKAPVIPFDRIIIDDTNNRLIESLRRSYGRLGLRDHWASDRFFASSYFEELYLYEVEPTVTLDCPVNDLMNLRYVRGHSRVYIVGKEIAHVSTPAIIGHGTLRRKGGELRVKIELPAIYGITESAQLRCRPVASPPMAHRKNQEFSSTIELVFVERTIE